MSNLSPEQMPGPKQPPRIHGDDCTCGDFARYGCPAAKTFKAANPSSPKPLPVYFADTVQTSGIEHHTLAVYRCDDVDPLLESQTRKIEQLEQSLTHTEAHWRQELEAYKSTQPETPKAQAVDGAGRTPTDYAIEFGEHLAKGAEAFLNASNDLNGARMKFDEEDTAVNAANVQHFESAYSDHFRGLQSDIYEFRKRAYRAERAVVPPCDCQKHTGHYPECVSQQTPPTPSFQFCVFDGPPPEGCADWYEWVAMPVHTRVFIRATTADDWKKPHEPNSYCRSRNCQEPRVKPFLYCAVHRQPDETEGSQS